MKTVRRGTKLHKLILESATGCTVYSEHNQYQGKSVDVGAAAMALHKFNFAKLVEEPGPKYVVRVHERCWFELKHGEDKPSAPEAITMNLQQTRLAYGYYLKKVMPGDMSYHNALRELVREVGTAELTKFKTMLDNGWACGECDTDNGAWQELCGHCGGHFTTHSNLVHKNGEWHDLNFR